MVLLENLTGPVKLILRQMALIHLIENRLLIHDVSHPCVGGRKDDRDPHSDRAHHILKEVYTKNIKVPALSKLMRDSFKK